MTKRSRQRAPRGTGSIYRTSDGRWRGAVTVTDAWTGERRRVVVSAADPRAARDALDERRRTIEAGGALEAGMTFGAYADRWRLRLRARVRPATFRHHVGALDRYLVPVLGRIALDAIRPDDVERVTAGMLARG